jgi:hypothetical protein
MVKIMRLGDERVHEANAQKLLTVFEDVKFHNDESIDKFAIRLNSLTYELHALGEKVDEDLSRHPQVESTNHALHHDPPGAQYLINWGARR